MIGDVTTRRELNITWRDPYAALEHARELSGLDYMRRLIAGDFPPPPIAELMDFTLIEVDDGRAVFRGVPGEQHLNPIGSVHGGFAATLLDSALGCAVHTTLNLVRGITPATGPVLAEATVVHAGRRTATAEGRLTAEDGGALLAHAKTTCLILR
jgi:uncharacterized protein (TIGR00369 family)